jgi:hypothetical protein
MNPIRDGVPAPKVVRCAIYTRKSTEEGLLVVPAFLPSVGVKTVSPFALTLISTFAFPTRLHHRRPSHPICRANRGIQRPGSARYPPRIR